MTTAPDGEIRAAVADAAAEARGVLEELVRIPSISASPEHAGGVDGVIRRVAELAPAAGGGRTEIGRSGAGQPALIASWPAPEGAPTVLLYAHGDVQPTESLAEGTSPTFEPTEREGRLDGREAADDKAGVAMHLAVLHAFGGKPPVGVVLFIEGEEEIGSPRPAAPLAWGGG